MMGDGMWWCLGVRGESDIREKEVERERKGRKRVMMVRLNFCKVLFYIWMEEKKRGKYFIYEKERYL